MNNSRLDSLYGYIKLAPIKYVNVTEKEFKDIQEKNKKKDIYW